MTNPPKVGVLTFHRCINYGSYWQARRLVEGLRRRGLDAVLMDHQSRRVDRAEWKCALSPALPTRSPRADRPAYAAKARKFFHRFAELPLSTSFRLEEPSETEAFDIVVVGSDEVWNLRHPWYAGASVFFGDGLKAGRVISYAASFGAHDATDRLDAVWADKLRRFSAIAVRDENSRRLVQDALQIDPPLVLDPCLQFVDADPASRSAADDRAVIYGHSFDGWFAEAVRHAADRHGLRLLSIGYRNDWADEQWLDAGPDEFAQAMANARAVVTNFFHGCVFALINGKPLMTTPSAYRRNKVIALVENLGAGEHLVDEVTPPVRYAELLAHPPKPAIGARLTALRRSSEVYLDHALAQPSAT
ncbi:polysaccharide pyruvyl transferase family protein [Phenylobacterium sp. LjRoot219]|uniref:polysaccharide pyruvyl transferase family protein n=1 Tax=Phenylobacterium sp. LjRoot219 TaxID=3342283 RepID=UPI003ECD66A9